MGDQEQKQEATGAGQQQQQQQDQQSRKIELDEDTYAALLDKIDELEGKVQPKGKAQQHEDEDDVDSLAREGRQAQGKPEEVNLDDLTPSQLVKVIRQQVSQEIAGPVLVAVNELKYGMEIDKLMRPAELGGEGIKDLLEYKQEIMELMIDNPKMSMKRAYTLARAENPDKVKTEKATDGRERETRLRHLPPHPKRAFGERPGQAESSTTEGEPKDLKGAVTKAFDEVFKGREV